MKTQYFTATSLDGFIATEDDSIDWLMALADPQDTGYADFIAEVGALAMGAATYEWILRHADAAQAQAGPAWPYTQPAWVFTHRSLPRPDGADVRFVQGDIAAVHAEMARVAAGKNVWIVGRGDLAGQFHDAGLLDELILHMAPVTLGRGKPLFPRRSTDPAWALVSAQPCGAGFAELRYSLRQPAEAPRGLRIAQAAHPGSTFRDAALGGSTFLDVGLQDASFENVALTGAVFRNVCLRGATIDDANLEGTRINGILVTDLLRAHQAAQQG